jgi:cardiolipin synthase
MNEAISAAKHSILLESFILADDERTHYFFENLRQKASEGVKVTIIADFVGSFGVNPLDRKALEAAGAEVLTFGRWLYRNHRKTLIIDESIAFVGGVNVRGKYENWFDLHLQLRGKPVRPLLKSFARVYRFAGGKNRHVLRYERQKYKKMARRIYESRLWIINHWPLKGKSALKSYYRTKCLRAKKSITIVTPYFIPQRWLIAILRRAIANGVRVEIILPLATDNWIPNIANHVFAEELQDELTFFFVPDMNHAKVLIVDDEEGLVGSNNIDAQSFNLNLEASAVFRHRGMLADLRNIVEEWKRTAVSVRRVNEVRPWYYRFAAWIIKAIEPVL